MAKQLAFGDTAQIALKKGLEKSARAIKYTLGPRGRNVMIDRGWGSPSILKDGSEVADEIELLDPCENLSAQILKEAVSKTNDQAGDGSTTTAILAEAIYLEGLKHLAAGVDAMSLARGLKKGVTHLVETLKKISQPLKTNQEIEQIAAIAAGYDIAVGKMLAEAIAKVSKDGVITIEEGKGIETEVKVVEGMQFDHGFISPYFVTDQENMQVVLEEPYILVYEDKINSTVDLVPLLEKISPLKKPLLIIAEEVEGDALALLVVNKVKGILSCAAVKAPGFGDRRKAVLEDIAIMIGARAVFKDLGVDLKTLKVDTLGRAKKVIIDSENTTLIEGAGATAKIKARIENIRKEIEKSDSDYDREKLQERLAKLAGGVAEINVGAPTEVELKEKKSRAESALHAVRAAEEEGFVPGGGITLLKLADKLDELKLTGDEALAIPILRNALEIPLRSLVHNAGYDGSVILRRIRNENKENFGFDVVKEKFTDMRKCGILDPAKVIRCALENAVSVSEMLLTSSVTITEIPEKEKTPSMPPGGMGGGMPGMGGGMPGMGGGMPGMGGGMPGMGGGMPDMGGMPGMGM